MHRSSLAPVFSAAAALLLATPGAHALALQDDDQFGDYQLVGPHTNAVVHATGDIDGDGDVDIVSGANNGGLRTFLNNGFGSFAIGPFITTDASWIRDLVLLDADNDGDLDIVSGIQDPVEPFDPGGEDLVWYENLTGTGTYGTKSIIDFSNNTSNPWIRLVLGDIDADGDPDLVALGLGQLMWYENLDGVGQSFGPRRNIAFPDSSSGVFYDFDAGDTDGDGDADILLGEKGLNPFFQEELRVSVLENVGPATTFTRLAPLATSPHLIEHVRMGDMDDDGVLDATTLWATRRLVWYRNLAPGFGPEIEIVDRFTFNTFIDTYEVARSDPDTRTHFFFHGRIAEFSPVFSGACRIENLSGAADFLDPIGAAHDSATFSDGRDISLADLDGDGDRDILVSHFATDNLAWSANAGPGDCNSNSVVDWSDIASGFSPDCNTNGVPDECELPQAAAEVSRLGSPANPNAFQPGVTSPPIVGKTWDPRIDHTTFLPAAQLDFVLVSDQTSNTSIPPYGTLLCTLPTIIEAPTSPAGVPFALPVPSNCNLIGLTLCTQGLSVDGGGGARLTNALDITIGTF